MKYDVNKSLPIAA